MESIKLDDENDGAQSDLQKLPRAGTVLNKKPSIENISANNIEKTVKVNDQSEDTSNNVKVDRNNSFSGTETPTKKEKTEENLRENEQHNFSETSVTTDTREKVQQELNSANNTFNSESGRLEVENVDSVRQNDKLDEETLKGKDEIIKTEDIPPSAESAKASEKDSGFGEDEERTYECFSVFCLKCGIYLHKVPRGDAPHCKDNCCNLPDPWKRVYNDHLATGRTERQVRALLDGKFLQP